MGQPRSLLLPAVGRYQQTRRVIQISFEMIA
jgi:hypothetical protein